MTENEETIPHIDYAERRKQRATERSLARRQRVPVMAIIGAIAVVALLVAADVAMSWERIHPGVRVADVKVGGMKRDAAALALETALTARSSRPIVLTYGDGSREISGAEIGLSFDNEAMIDDAMAIGRTGGVLNVVVARLAAWTGTKNLPARPRYNEARVEAVWESIAKDTDVDPVDATVRIEGTRPTVVPGSDGQGLDRTEATARIIRAMLASDRTVQAPIKKTPMAVNDDEASKAKDVAERMLSASASVTHSQKTWEFTAEDIATWIAFRRSDELPEGAEETGTVEAASDEVTLVAYVSAPRAGKTIMDAVGAKVGRPARNARFTTRGGRVSIIASQEGIGPDIDLLSSELTAELADPSSDRTVALTTTRVEPTLTTAEAKDMGIQERISRYTTTYDSGNLPRVNNIHQLGDALDGKLVRPGGTFSFNGAVGERTAAKGYKEANAIVNGKLVPQLGGGICQVGTTLFNTVFESGLPVIERRNHSFYISHYPKGRDATVSWGGPDFKFKNDTENWVLISVSYTSSSITIALYGTDPGYDIDSTTSAWRNTKPFPIENIKDSTMEVGSKIIEDEGVTGRTITVTRTVQKNGQIVRTDSFVSVYKPKTQVVRVGTKPKRGSVPTTQTP